MHFFYLDEAGCTGANLLDSDQPVFVLGGVSIRDEGWMKTQDAFARLISDSFGGSIPGDFELHATHLLSPNGDGPFGGMSRDERNQLALEMLDLLRIRKHEVHMYAIDKRKLHQHDGGVPAAYGLTTPYLLAYDYLLTHIDDHVRNNLGSTARGMLIVDVKDQHLQDVADITLRRRSAGSKSARVKRIVEFTQPVDSKRNTMVQLSDLVVYCTKRFLEIDLGFKDGTPPAAQEFYAQCYARIDERRKRKGPVPRLGSGFGDLDNLLADVEAKPRRGWKGRYGS